ncbi:hypothetical protein HDU97_008579 [Phlyctochytrium planicorne]|nr:hypothetical protein HDU97_008579 [Phlyctochytrium planicorne]
MPPDDGAVTSGPLTRSTKDAELDLSAPGGDRNEERKVKDGSAMTSFQTSAQQHADSNDIKQKQQLSDNNPSFQSQEEPRKLRIQGDDDSGAEDDAMRLSQTSNGDGEIYSVHIRADSSRGTDDSHNSAGSQLFGSTQDDKIPKRASRYLGLHKRNDENTEPSEPLPADSPKAFAKHHHNHESHHAKGNPHSLPEGSGSFFNLFFNYRFASDNQPLPAPPPLSPQTSPQQSSAAAYIAQAAAGVATAAGAGLLQPRANESAFQDEERREMILFTLFCAIGIVIGYLEGSGVFNAPYSKFRKERWSTLGYMSTRLGMLIINAATLLLIICVYAVYADMTCPFHLVTIVTKGKKTMSRPYRIPRGGLFYHVTCPHYLLEVLAWVGFSVTVHRPAIYGQVLYIFCKLAGRAYQTRKWYIRNVQGFPARRTAIIPYIF